MEQLPDEVVQLIFHHLHSGSALVAGSLTSRKFRDALWSSDPLWQEAFDHEFGSEARDAVLLHGTTRIRTRLKSNQTQTDNIGWRQKYAEHNAFLKEVDQDRSRRIINAEKQKSKLYGPQPEHWLNLIAWGFLSPIFNFVAIPLLVVLIILRAENIITWSLHAVLAPADFLFLCGFCLFGFFFLSDRCGPFILFCVTAIFPVASATVHWAAARADWIVASGGALQSPDTPGGLNWFYIFTPAMVMALMVVGASAKYIYRGRRTSDFFPTFFIGGLAPLLAVAFLVLLAYKLQWGGPGFLFTYTFIPLWLYPVGIETFFIKYGHVKSHPIRFLLLNLGIPVPIAVTLVLVALRLDWGLVHMGFVAIPTLCWPVASTSTDASFPLIFPVPDPIIIHQSGPGSLTEAEQQRIEDALLQAYGPFIHPPPPPPPQPPKEASPPRKVAREDFPDDLSDLDMSIEERNEQIDRIAEQLGDLAQIADQTDRLDRIEAHIEEVIGAHDMVME
ncbi:hypothetical protein PAPYR_5762 [Paratrimastix pyriformis]|uniref:F-box domain-containing protein n=1 Tax=Paratrimastix pyriformis TaxID=342808 RepID=A0ABQ8UH35_9EUKA|nr:hypothetical protein PAPYR_5762 [Paratrimastix pyriformis]